MATLKTPPVVGIRATSPKVVLKVERSSWPNCIYKTFSHREKEEEKKGNQARRDVCLTSLRDDYVHMQLGASTCIVYRI